MGNIGVPEMIFIFVLALLIFGPRKLPELGRSLGKALAEFRRASADLRRTVEDEMYEIERQTREMEQETHDAVATTSDSRATPPATASPDGSQPSIAPPAAPRQERSSTDEKPGDGHSRPA